MLMELTTFLRQLKENQQISVVLFTSSGSSFCTGLDFPTLINENPAARQDSANRMALLIKYVHWQFQFTIFFKYK